MKTTRKILVIEDTEDVRNNIKEILETEDYEVSTAENGKIGVDVALANTPDLIICDIMMPELDGYEVLERLRKDIRTATTPFIFLTAKNTREDHRRGMALGADDYIAKPFTIDELINAVEARLSRAAEFKQKSEEKLNELTRNMGTPITRVIQEPLKAVIGFSQLVMTEYPNMEKPEIAEFMSLIFKAGLKLNGIVHKTLLYYQLEAAIYNPTSSDLLTKQGATDSNPAIQNAINELAQRYGRQADLQLHLEAHSPVKIPFELLKTLVSEIIENAMLYSPKRTPIKIISGSDLEKTVITVADEGLGMSEEQISRTGAFSTFTSNTQEVEGVGLGLTIAKKIIDLFGGSLSIRSTPGIGTTVRITIPNL